MNSKLNYFITRFSFLGIGYYLLYKNSKQDSYIPIILGTLLGIGILYILNLIDQKCDKNKRLYKIIFNFINMYFILIAFTLLPLFVTSFYLVHTPVLALTIPFLLSSLYTLKKGKKILYNLSNLLYPVSIIFILLAALSLIQYVKVTSYLPILNTSNQNILTSTLFFTAMSSIPNMLSLNHGIEFKIVLKNYLISSVILLMEAVITIGCIEPTLISVYSFPEYVVLKRVTILDFIENIENILSIIWYCDIYFVITTCFANLKENINNKLIYYTSILFPFILATTYFSRNYVKVLILFNNYPYCLGLLFIIFVGYNLFNRQKKSVEKID